MTPKQKAKELIKRFGIFVEYDECANSCAIECVDEIMQLWNKGSGRMLPFKPEDYTFWNEVKQEI